MLLPFTPISQLSPTEQKQLLSQYSKEVLREIKTPYITFNGKHINVSELMHAAGGKQVLFG